MLYGITLNLFSTGYIPPNLAISVLYWKAWLMLLLLTAHNPTSFGSAAWNLYPTLRALMEMCITNSFTSSSALTTTPDQQEIQIATMEKQKIIEFETYLAAASTKTVINENNSLLLSQVSKRIKNFFFFFKFVSFECVRITLDFCHPE